VAKQSEQLEMQTLDCLYSLGISSLAEWDVLVFLSRRGASLGNADQIARLLGYPSKTVGSALDKLESHQLIQRSKSSKGVRLYQVAPAEPHLVPESCFQQLIGLARKRSGRLLIVKLLRHNEGFQIVAKGESG
jgi:hypothetical protein